MHVIGIFFNRLKSCQQILLEKPSDCMAEAHLSKKVSLFKKRIGGTDGYSPKACNNRMCRMLKEQFSMKTLCSYKKFRRRQCLA